MGVPLHSPLIYTMHISTYWKCWSTNIRSAPALSSDIHHAHIYIDTTFARVKVALGISRSPKVSHHNKIIVNNGRSTRRTLNKEHTSSNMQELEYALTSTPCELTDHGSTINSIFFFLQSYTIFLLTP